MASRWLAPGATLATVAAVFAGSAGASQTIDRNASAVRLSVSADGRAMVTYRARGKLRHVTASGAINALAPTPGKRQVAFKTTFGQGAKSRELAARQGNACRPYDGPKLLWLVAACKAPDGSYWALQSWQRSLPNHGAKPTKRQAARELRLSHWSGELPTLNITPGWAYGGKFDHLFGSLTYQGNPVFGFRATKRGVPLDSWGRNLYVDTFNSVYGRGWKRENSFLTRQGTGTFCYGLYDRGGRVGKGKHYRVSVIGPGVTPDITWQSAGPGIYDAARERARGAALLTAGSGNDQRLCSG